MAFIIVPSASAAPIAAFSFPERVSLVMSDDGGGGDIFLNGRGVLNAALTGAVDLKTFFVTTISALFRSGPLLSAFKQLVTQTDNAACAQLVRSLDITIVPVDAGGRANIPHTTYLGAVGGLEGVPFLKFSGPAVAGSWRVDITLRHSITN